MTFNGNPAFQRPFDNGDNANFSINGGLRQTNAFLIDGAPDDAISDTAGDRSHANLNVAYIPSVEATREFKIVNNFYDAQYGRTSGGIFNVVTKSGTNVTYGQESVGQIWYNAAQVSIEKRYSHGFTILAVYTWSKTEEAVSYLNPQDAAPFKNIGAADRRSDW